VPDDDAELSELIASVGAALAANRPEMPEDAGWRALDDGDVAGAVAHAEAMLQTTDDDERHRAHTLLGYVYLRAGDIDGAERELLLSSQVEATAVLSSFGPDLGLAWELLVAGRGDAVSVFAQRFSRFWVGPGQHAI
jgi:hypothetical protein